MPFQLGYDTYSLRAFQWDAFQHLEFAAQQKLNAIQFSSLDAFRSFEPDYLSRVKQRAEELGIKVDGGVGCVCELSKSWNGKAGSPRKVLEQGLDVAHGIGATVMRCFMGTDKDRLSTDHLRNLTEATVRNFKAVRAKARDLNVKIAIENHKDLLAHEALDLIQKSGTDFVGSNLDVGNPLTIMEHPLTTVEVLGPHALTSHWRDTAVYETRDGAAAQWTALGDGSVDLKELLSHFAQLAPKVPVHLEIITGRAAYQLPFLRSEFWKRFESMRAADFARFVALSKRGQPFSGEMVIEDIEGEKPAPEFAEALRAQQKRDLERSFQYARNVLGVGAELATEKAPA